MDDQRFDRLARSLAHRTSRRTVLRTAGAAAAAGVLARGTTAFAQVDCEAPLVDCNGVCVDLLTDMDNCGACGEVCESGLVGVACIGGECVRTSCPAALPRQCGRRSTTASTRLPTRTTAATVDRLRKRRLRRWRLRLLRRGSDHLRRLLRRHLLRQRQLRRLRRRLHQRPDLLRRHLRLPERRLRLRRRRDRMRRRLHRTCCDNNNCGGCGIVCTGSDTCFEGICGCPSGNCDDPEPTPPLTLPNTGAGANGSTPDPDGPRPPWSPASSPSAPPP